MKQNIAHFEQVKIKNKKIVRNVLRNKECMGISELASVTGLSYPTVSNLLKELVTTGEVIETTDTVSNGGRPAVQYALNVDHKLGAVIIIERSEIKYSIINIFGEKLKENKISSKDFGKARLLKLIEEIYSEHNNLDTIAMGIPGVAVNNEIKRLEVFSDLQDTNLADLIKEEFGIDLLIENDSNAMAIAQINGKESFAHIIHTHSCMGTGIVINGELFRGAYGYAGEVHPLCNFIQDSNAGITEVVRIITSVLNLGKIYISADKKIDIDSIYASLEDKFDYGILPEIHQIENVDEVYEKGLVGRLEAKWQSELTV